MVTIKIIFGGDNYNKGRWLLQEGTTPAIQCNGADVTSTINQQK